MTFFKQIDAFSKKAIRNMDATVRNVAYAVTEAAQVSSPVLTGRYRASWRITEGGVDGSFEPERFSASEFETGLSDPAVSAKLFGEIAGFRAGSVLNVTQNIFYVDFIEEGNSEKTPDGVAAPLALRVATIAENVQRYVSGEVPF